MSDCPWEFFFQWFGGGIMSRWLWCATRFGDHCCRLQGPGKFWRNVFVCVCVRKLILVVGQRLEWEARLWELVVAWATGPREASCACTPLTAPVIHPGTSCYLCLPRNEHSPWQQGTSHCLLLKEDKNCVFVFIRMPSLEDRDEPKTSRPIPFGLLLNSRSYIL